MLAVVGVLLVGLAIVGLFLTMRRSDQASEERHPWSIVAEHLGLRFGPGVRAHGLCADVYINMVRELPESETEARTRITANVLSPASLDVVRRDWESPEGLSTGGVFTLDHRFDAMFEVQGDEAEGVAILNAATRQLCIDTYLRGDVAITGGVVIWLQDDLGRPDQLKALLGRLMQLARSFDTEAGPYPARLLANACDGSADPLRFRNLRLLFSSYPESAEAVGIARTVTAAHDPETRLAAATFLSDMTVLRELARSGTIPQRLRLAARRHLELLAVQLRQVPLFPPLEDSRPDTGE